MQVHKLMFCIVVCVYIYIGASMPPGGTWPTCLVELATQLMIAGGVIPTGKETASALPTVPLASARTPSEEETVESTSSPIPATTTQ